MSSNEESDDQFESADEDIDFEPHSVHNLEIQSENLVEIGMKQDNSQQKIDHIWPQLENQLDLTSIKDKQIKSMVGDQQSSQPIETRNQTDQLLDKSIDIKGQHIKPEDHKTNISAKDHKTDLKIEKQTSDTIFDHKNDENKPKEAKFGIKSRKLLRKVDRFKPEDKIDTKEEEDKIDLKEEEEDKIDLKEEEEEDNNKIDIKEEEEEEEEEEKEEEEEEDNKLDDKREDIKTEGELISDTILVNRSEENAPKERTLIKGRKLLRKADRLREQNTSEESEISEEKKTEVLNKLSDLSQRDDSSNKWNNWFTDIKSAAMTATSTTVSHVSQASNKWSLNPKSLLTSAVSITSNVGSGLSSVVENVSSVVDSAIGAPPPEQMAAFVNKDSTVNERPKIDKQSTELGENQSKSVLGFGLFDYTLNTLESIGKKTMEVIVDDKRQKVVKTDKND